MNTNTNEPGIYVAPLERQFKRLLTPLDHFIHRQTASGLLLMVTTILALIIANSGLAYFYENVLHTHFSVQLGGWGIDKSIHHWVNDGLMAFFFFVVGLELKREILVGELADIRKAALPIIAAIGGMVVPAGIYWAFNHDGIGQHGWGIPMATDIAFAVGALALLASRVPRALVAFLVALAIVDDLGAVIVIAVFYTSDLNTNALWAAAGITLLLLSLNAGGVRKILPYFLLAVPLWYALLLSGVHPTLAGVIGAFTVPARPKYNPAHFRAQVQELLGRFDADQTNRNDLFGNEDLRMVVQSMEQSTHKVMTPLQRLENIWHMPVAFLVIPIFALFNAGITVDLANLPAMMTHPVMLGVMVGLIGGKFIGIFTFSWIAVKLGIARLPDRTNYNQIGGVALLAGIGFTMSIFIAQLSFPGHEELQLIAKTGIFLASLMAGIGGFIWLWIAGKPTQDTIS